MNRDRFGREMGAIDNKGLLGICAGCGVDETEWQGNHGQGYKQDGHMYCCQDCAEDIECSCNF
jgi:hypothetical protein